MGRYRRGEQLLADASPGLRSMNECAHSDLVGATPTHSSPLPSRARSLDYFFPQMYLASRLIQYWFSYCYDMFSSSN
jgi:hypothetical protein